MDTIRSLLKKATERLRLAGIDNPYLDSEVLLMDLMDITRIDIVKDRDRIIDKETLCDYFKLIDERAKGRPIQYMTGHQEFMGLDFSVGEGVLIPRADTEILVEKVIELIKDKKNLRIADICTGSGAIAISLAHFIEDSYVYAVDISKDALKFCRLNAIKNGVIDRVRVIEGDLLEPFENMEKEGELDVLVSNPPYIESEDMGDLPISVRDYEPHLALDGGEKGLYYYKKILQAAPKLLKRGGLLIFEIGYNQGDALASMIEELGAYKGIGIEKDLAMNDRCVYCYYEGVDRDV